MTDEHDVVVEEDPNDYGLLTMTNIGNVISEIEIATPSYLESSTQYDDMDSKNESFNSSIGTQVDIRSLISELELNKEESAEIFWQKMAEQSKAALEEAKDENKKLNITIDYLARENVRYQQILDEQEAMAAGVVYDDHIIYPPLPDDAFGETASAVYNEYRNSDNSCSL